MDVNIGQHESYEWFELPESEGYWWLRQGMTERLVEVRETMSQTGYSYTIVSNDLSFRVTRTTGRWKRLTEQEVDQYIDPDDLQIIDVRPKDFKPKEGIS